MKIKKIRLKNGYKRFKDLTIDLGDNPTKVIALVGPNGCGKSSVFDGMLFSNSVHQAIGQFGAKESKFHSMEGLSTFDSTNIEIEFDNGNLQMIKTQKKPSGKENTIFSYRNPYRYNSNLDVKSLKEVPDIKKNNVGASSSIDLDDKMTQNYQRLYVYLTKYRKENGLTDVQAQNKVIGDLNEMLKKCLGLTIVDEGDILAGKGTLFFKKESQSKEFEFNVLSSGEKEVVDILLDLYLKKEEYDDTIYIIDEPELHLNTGIQKNLLIEIEKIIPENCQLWIATHSIGFLNALKENLTAKCSIIHFDGDFSTEPKTLTPMVKNRTNWQNIFQTALEDLTGLIAPKRIVYCEGRKDPTSSGSEQGFDALVYNKIFSEKEPDTLFISSGGNTEPEKYSAIALTVLGKAFEGVELLLLRDKDIHMDGETSTTDEDRLKFIAQNPNVNIMLMRKEIENYLFDFEVLSKKFPSLSKTDYDTLVTDIQSQNVKDLDTQIIKLCGVTLGSLSKEDFKKQLAQEITPETEVYKELYRCIF